ncbi:bifunctional transcriptional activator/DNA repair enzyme AdaA [Sporomusa sp.]|uniref:bifunctional transcriptional activator/DNA repair enzyme AdaA n=1 Tax=Sporomusa sp. TaxID=2078658 RepID=UPI002D1D6D28|nr:Ada metal-binding domain-containing protein [Sporomusa sp.]HWR07195.1 Ada metal-binding domain-containing protein [Sporomusa sp.]
MEKTGDIPDSVKWQAVTECNKSCDGLFFYGVKTTGIFCRPACRAKTPRRENVVFFSKLDQAISAGFRPCKKCRPDVLVFEPDIELVRKALAIFDQQYNQSIEVGEISKQLGVSSPHLARLFKQHVGFTPAQYLTKIRVESAVRLLEQTDRNILEVAYTAGFISLSNFYKCFKEQIGVTPNQFRKRRGDL